MRRPEVIFTSVSIWDQPCEKITSDRRIDIKFAYQKEVRIDMTTVNIDALLATIPLLDKQAQEKIVLDIVFKHEIGCTCSMCEAIKLRHPLPDADHPDRFAEQGGEHQSFPFDATNLTSLQSIAKSLAVVASAVERTSSTLESVRDVLRGRDSENKVVTGPFRAIADFLLRGQTPTSPPQTQRNPTQQQLSTQQPATAAPVLAGKRIATDYEMSGERGDPKIRFDPKRDWIDVGKPSFKGRKASECDPVFLELYAGGLDFFAYKAHKAIDAGDASQKTKDSVKFDSLDAARVRGWAHRIRSGIVPQAAPPPAVYAGGDDYC
jgi:hypothetical protein